MHAPARSLTGQVWSSILAHPRMRLAPAVNAAEKYRLRRIISELDDEGEHQVEKVDVLSSEIETENAVVWRKEFRFPASLLCATTQGASLRCIDSPGGFVCSLRHGNRG